MKAKWQGFYESGKIAHKISITFKQNLRGGVATISAYFRKRREYENIFTNASGVNGSRIHRLRRDNGG